MQLKIDRNLIKRLKQLEKVEEVKKVVQVNGSELQRSMQSYAPVDTGFLRRSINLSSKEKGMSVSVKPTADYAPYVEYGTRYMAAQPFVRPAFKTQETIFKKDIERLFKE